ncbi:signal peptidase I, putative [Babesia ovata]|uniref:Signal peptidase I, putative n=1 Tax=Babesia ovata TaxID=189622 RepID=A0A2H6K9E7_9APIC|nr:signal peptidase I, putative [Babesia ovata]GBE59579.1 signal peptidase I, putative [Babesia ovata]
MDSEGYSHSIGVSIGSSSGGLIGVMIFGIIGGIIFGLICGIIFGLICGFIGGIIGNLVYGFRHFTCRIEPIVDRTECILDRIDGVERGHSNEAGSNDSNCKGDKDTRGHSGRTGLIRRMVRIRYRIECIADRISIMERRHADEGGSNEVGGLFGIITRIMVRINYVIIRRRSREGDSKCDPDCRGVMDGQGERGNEGEVNSEGATNGERDNNIGGATDSQGGTAGKTDIGRFISRIVDRVRRKDKGSEGGNGHQDVRHGKDQFVPQVA